MAQAFLSFTIFLITMQVVFSIIPKEIEEACQKESGFSGTGLTINFKDPASVSKEAKCYLSCTITSQKAMNDDGTINRDGALAIINKIANGNEDLKQKLIKVMGECIAEVPTTPDKCENAFEYVRCKRTKMEV